MTLVDPLRERYDETPYQDQAFEDLDLARLRGMAQLFGLNGGDADGTGLRVLDLACASGAHLREQASRYPGAHFRGIDFSEHEIDMGRKEIERSGLTNVELVHADLRDVEIEAGAYDLILCHGAFSWVPDDVKDRILQLSRAGLAPGGIAAIAYLTYPGWKQKEALRELLAMRVRDVQEPSQKIAESAVLLKFLHAAYSARTEDGQAQSFKAIVEGMQKSSTNVFLHDELGSDHDPCYFMQFAEWAGECGLQYLAETDLATMTAQGLPAQASVPLERLAPDFLETQQLLDFVVNRSGRCSMLVRSDASFERALDRNRLSSLRVATRWVDVTPLNAAADAPRWFESPQGQRVAIEDSDLLRWLERLLDAGPEPVPFQDLLELGGGNVESEATDRRRLLELISLGIAEPRAVIE